MLEHAAIARLSDTLALRRDAGHVRERLAAAFIAHRELMWPAGEPAATDAWIAAHVDELLATAERLYAYWSTSDDEASTIEFLDRMAWLSKLAAELEGGERWL